MGDLATHGSHSTDRTPSQRAHNNDAVLVSSYSTPVLNEIYAYHSTKATT